MCEEIIALDAERCEMPEDFERCRRAGGRIRTIKPKGKGSKTYMPVCYDKKNKAHPGETKKRKGK